MKIIAGAREELSPVQIRDHIFLNVEVKEVFLPTYAHKTPPQMSKGKRHALIVESTHSLFVRSHLG